MSAERSTTVPIGAGSRPPSSRGATRRAILDLRARLAARQTDSPLPAFEPGASACAPATLEVLDLAGRRVATLASDVADPGAQTTRWDGRDDRGAPAAPAIYLLRLRSGTVSCTLRLVLVR